ncbi:hypothetical protein Tco_0456740 [Tanacetum coccineum]
MKASKSRKRARVVEFDDEKDLEDPSKQGRSLIKELDMDARISLVPSHAADEERNDDTQIYDQPVEQLGVRRPVSTGSGRVSTGSGRVSTASRTVSTAVNWVVLLMSMDEELAKKVFEEEQAKAMTEQEQERINFEAALELQK